MAGCGRRKSRSVMINNLSMRMRSMFTSLYGAMPGIFLKIIGRGDNLAPAGSDIVT